MEKVAKPSLSLRAAFKLLINTKNSIYNFLLTCRSCGVSIFLGGKTHLYFKPPYANVCI